MEMEVTVIDIYEEIHKIPYRRYEYRSLMELIVNTYYSEIGECKGKGLCGTCIVEIIGEDINNSVSKEEHNTLKVNNKNYPQYRLACQLILDEKINNSIFKVVS